jgi:hypothetical protein
MNYCFIRGGIGEHFCAAIIVAGFFHILFILAIAQLFC